MGRKSRLDPFATKLLRDRYYPVSNLRSKSGQKFALSGKIANRAV